MEPERAEIIAVTEDVNRGRNLIFKDQITYKLQYIAYPNSQIKEVLKN